MSPSVSITRRLIITVLLLELVAALALIAAITINERHVQFKAFDASLVASAESLMGAVQDADDEADNVLLDMRSVRLGRDAIFRVEDDRGKLLGSAGELPSLENSPATTQFTFRNADAGKRGYRFVIFHALRIVDPGDANGGVHHSITIVYGMPVGHVWHEVFEAIRFFAIATALLLGLTGIIMAWLVRKTLSPVYELAREAERISSSDWHFNAPANAKNTIELRPLAAALEAAIARLQRSFEQQKRLTSDAAHELKTDVAIVKSSLQLLTMRKRSVEEYAQGLARSIEDCTRLELTVQKMLTLARLEQPIENSAPRTCSLRDAVEDAVQQSQPFAELKAIRFTTHFEADAQVPIDSRDALLLCSNIVLNALQHSPEGSTVHIATTAQNNEVQLTIQDQGEGISDEESVHLFEPFFRGDPSRSRHSGGTGLGLSICRAICQHAGGSIVIANSDSGGARVTITLPAKFFSDPSALSASVKSR